MYVRIALISWRTAGTTAARSQAEAPLDFVVGDAFTAVEFRQPRLDLREKHQALDRFIDTRVGREFAEGFDYPIPCELSRHFAMILAPFSSGDQIHAVGTPFHTNNTQLLCGGQ